jgi:hypothetical protein
LPLLKPGSLSAVLAQRKSNCEESRESQPKLNPKLPSAKSHIQVVQQASELGKATFNVESDKGRPAVHVPGLGIIDDFMASDDLNECVDALLKKRSKAALQ